MCRTWRVGWTTKALGVNGLSVGVSDPCVNWSVLIETCLTRQLKWHYSKQMNSQLTWWKQWNRDPLDWKWSFKLHFNPQPRLQLTLQTFSGYKSSPLHELIEGPTAPTQFTVFSALQPTLQLTSSFSFHPWTDTQFFQEYHFHWV